MTWWDSLWVWWKRKTTLSGEKIVEGDIVVGLPSSGLHTNGYSLVRKVFGIDRDALALKR
jgi:phosphoribosylformylglycinamidine cyclo-ligase